MFGESAGGNAVTTLMAVPSAHGLFARAIAQSSPTNAVYPAEQTARWAAEFVASSPVGRAAPPTTPRRSGCSRPRARPPSPRRRTS
ncbi:Carboxylesterase family protein [Clavibacter michiganensis subsp. michiganensis]|uniref:Carboxylesterase family protein n=1 Tax=Clavibacter michiganensis subsp. michiganensis TaxID=33013 RepID=A0A251XI22_CLAMM|nr:Carboxylesterase family protein [Clavibacter michiganensis subsp. michiganensis]OUE02301.1 Carboxylesterase family protein [Clavibacter michiganensis subsp. michiganensis]